MSELNILPPDAISGKFIPTEYLQDGRDQFTLRNQQVGRPEGFWRNLRADEIEALVRNGNAADNWDDLLVTDEFTPRAVRNCEFHGLVRLGRLRRACLEYHELVVPVGLTNSRIVSCDLGDDVAVHNVRYLAHTIVGDNTILLNIDELHTTNHAKFGNGIVKDGEDEKVRIWMDVINEAGGRSVMPFDGMTAADAYLWAKFRGDAKLMARLAEITQQQFDARRGFYGVIGDHCVIKNCRIIKDVKIGPYAYIKGANKLKNLTINSTAEEPSQIGEGVELVNGIIGRGCHVFYGCKAVRFVMGDCSNLKYGARLIHAYLGDNSTISCCEVLHDLIFPAHEQHHNNSFLTAALVKGQSNVAACATLGSNHNSRANDGELEAGRGFWPGLCVSVKHSCRFASFTLLAKGDYPAELDVPTPFSLVSDDTAHDRLRIMPAYWWMYNMYALARNGWKFRSRDRRVRKIQHIEFDALAPDTVEEILRARDLLARWTAQAHRRAAGAAGDLDDDALLAAGRKLLEGPADPTDGLEILGEGIENSSRKVVILKARPAWGAYGQMLDYYAVTNLMAFMAARPDASLADMNETLNGGRCSDWVNLGGQLVRRKDLTRLIRDINAGTLATWNAIHNRYDHLWERYPLDKQTHAMSVLRERLGVSLLTADAWAEALDRAVAAQRFICEQVYVTRRKDYDNPFRQITFADDAERRAVLGSPEDNSFVRQVRQETDQFVALAEQLRHRG
ncbi:MAG: DUF4954 family protein [Planctomycetes bacterium]|nr:DUF4954 family protein [Planctomycetota bacterium]